jgi:hypothetical protein|tara:strand:+ start:2712 stop:3209 length:498 start_codon:yes stop_codon:yes gene_type:complete
MANNDQTSIHVQLAELTKDVQQVNNIQSRLDIAIDKLTDVSTHIKSMLAVHEEKIEHQEKIDDVIFSKLKIRASETSTLENETRQLIEESEHRLLNEIKERKTENINSETRIMNEIKDLKKNMGNRVSLLEKYKWIIIGAFLAMEAVTALSLSRNGLTSWFSFLN